MDVPALTLHVDAGWESPWAFHAFVALEEKQLPFTLALEALPLSDDRRAALAARGVLGKVPMLIHALPAGEVAFTESLAISEYLAETFRYPAHPRLYPADLGERARARQILSWLRTSQVALRAERSTARVFSAARGPAVAPMSTAARAQADELLAVAARVIPPGRPTLCATWSIADADLALALMRLIDADDPVPTHLVTYARAQWARPSVQRFVEGAYAARRAG